jgi:molybdenum cofactor cytidylyltransferase
VKFGPVALADAEGAILAHGVSTARAGRLPKGTLVTPHHIDALHAEGVASVIVARLEPGDVMEDAAAERIAALFARNGLRIDPAATGRVNLFSAHSGVLRVRASLIHRLNAIDPAITIATLPDNAAVKAGAMIATVKIIPFALPAPMVAAVCALPLSGSLIVHGFRPLHAVLLQTELPINKVSVLDKTARVTAERITSLGGTMTDLGRCAHDATLLSQRLKEARGDIVIVFGASAMTDAEDVIPQAICLAGGTVERVGMPVDPGNLLVLGHIGSQVVVGAPGCARSPKENGFDWVLARFFAGMRVTARDIARMGVGGLLMEIPSRPRPRLGDNHITKADD